MYLSRPSPLQTVSAVWNSESGNTLNILKKQIAPLQSKTERNRPYFPGPTVTGFSLHRIQIRIILSVPSTRITFLRLFQQRKISFYNSFDFVSERFIPCFPFSQFYHAYAKQQSQFNTFKFPVPLHNSPFPANTAIGTNRTEMRFKGEEIMKATGIVRRVDDLGRIVIPKEIRRTLRIREGDPLQTSLTRWEKYCFSMLDLAKRRGW